MPLQAKHWQIISRVNEAADVPFRSLRFRADNHDDAYAISLLQFAPRTIEAVSPRLLPKDPPLQRPMSGYFRLHNTDEFKFKPAPMIASRKKPSRRFKYKQSPSLMGLLGWRRSIDWIKSWFLPRNFPLLGRLRLKRKVGRVSGGAVRLRPLSPNIRPPTLGCRG
jgi:hypothetical protein